MSKYLKIISIALCVLFSGVLCAQTSINPVRQISEEWSSSITPYVWGPGLMATVNNDNGPVKTADFSMGQVLSNLKSGVMGASEIHKGNWGFMGDFFSATLQNSGSFNATDSSGSARVADKITLQATMFTGAALYTVVGAQDLNVDVLAGVRAAYATSSVNLNDRATSVNASTTFNTIVPIAGFKGRYRLLDTTWYVPFYADAGGGSGTTSLTWQAILGVGKALNNSIDVSLTYRALEADLRGHGSVMKANLKGPQMAVTFNF